MAPVRVFTPGPGRTHDVIKAQTGDCLRLRGMVKGAPDNCLLRALDGLRVVGIARFESVEPYDALRESAISPTIWAASGILPIRSIRGGPLPWR